MAKVLDFGYVNFIESWGSDESIITAARMSTNKGFQGWGPNLYSCPCHNPDACEKCQGRGNYEVPGDEKLLRYLWEHKHHTPFEMAGMVIEVQAPIMVFREWHRHRTQCLAGNAKITCLSPTGTPFTRTIKEIYDLKYGGTVDDFSGTTKNGYSKNGTLVTRKRRLRNDTRTRILPNCQSRLLRVLDESTLQFTAAPMLDVWRSGVKKVYTVKTDKGEITASAQHPFYTKDGWKQLQYLKSDDLIATPGKISVVDRPIPPALRSGIGVWTSTMRSRLILPVDRCYACGDLTEFENLDLDHVIPVNVDLALALTTSNLKPICKKCHRSKTAEEQPDRRGKTALGIRWAVVSSVEVVGEEETYDISVAGPHHNFIANGFVVHNSYNEMSGRYTELPNLYYLPELSRIQRQAKHNKQGSAEPFDVLEANNIRLAMESVVAHARHAYERMLEVGVAREIARLVLPVNQYSRMRASANLRNWLGFLTLRMAPNAQWEIREYANAVATIVEAQFPRTYALFREGYDQTVVS